MYVCVCSAHGLREVRGLRQAHGLGELTFTTLSQRIVATTLRVVIPTVRAREIVAMTSLVIISTCVDGKFGDDRSRQTRRDAHTQLGSA